MMNNLFAHPASAWVLTWVLHSTILLGSVVLFEWFKPHSAPKLREYLWRLGLVMSFVSATVVTSGVFSSPLGQVELERPTVAATAAPVIPKAAPLVALRSVSIDRQGTPRTVLVPMADTQTDVRGRTPAIKRYIPEMILLFWGLIVSFLMVRFSVTLKTVIGLLGDRRVLAADHRAQVLLRQLNPTRRLLRLPKLTVNGKGAGPVSLPGNEICLPQWAAESLTDAQLKAVLAHELAHCLRFDAFWLLGSNVLRRVFFFQPLLHLAHYRLSDTAEMAADEIAVQLTGDEKSVAASLTECAGRVKFLQPAWGAAMASNPSSFLIRVRRLLQPEHFSRGGPGWRVKLSVFVATLAVTATLPSFIVAGEDDDRTARSIIKKSARAKDVSTIQGGTTTIRTDNEGRVTVIDVSHKRKGYALKVKGRGDFELNDAEDDVDCMPQGAKLEIVENLDGTTRKVLFKAKNGSVSRTFWLDGKRIERDRDTNRWLAEMLPRLMRETGLNPDQRVQRLHKKGGTKLVLSEIGQIRGDFSTRGYIESLVRIDDLNNSEFDQLLDYTRGIDSDFESRQALTSISNHEKLTDTRAKQFLDVAENIDSDFERREALSTFATRATPDTAGWSQAIQAAAGINSDFECAEALTTIVHHMPATDENVNLYRDALSGISGEFERKRAEDALDRRLGIEL